MSDRDDKTTHARAAQAPRGQALTGLRVLDVSGSVATSYCAKLFADEGAEVINVEPPAGFTTRGLPPFVPAAEPPEHSAMHRYLQANKASIVLDPAAAADRTRLEGLLRRADVVIDAVRHEQPMAPMLAPEQLQDIAPGIVRTSITWFGQTGPCADFTGSNAVCQALAGLIRTIGPVAGPPLLPTGYQAEIVAGTSAFIGTLGNLFGRELGNGTEEVVHLDTSVLEANLCFTEVGAVGSHLAGGAAPRMGINRFPPTYPLGIYQCRDGWLGVTALTPPQWQAFCSLLGMVDEAREPRYGSSLQRLADAPMLDPIIASRVRERSARELFERGQAMRIPLAPVPTMAELFTTEQYVARGAFADVTHDDGHSFPAPVAPFRLFHTPSLAGGHVVRLGADNDRVLTDLEAQEPRRRAASSSHRRAATAPLRGIRVLDLSMGWAGPLATRHLSDLGAEIIKVESCQHTDWWRGFEPTPQWVEDDQAEKSVSFNTMNRNKLDVTLDLTKDRGKQLLKRLATVSDAVIENYSGGVLQKLGLEYSALRSVNDELVMLSMPAFGSTGEWRHYRAYGSTVEHASGLPHLHGGAADPPVMLHVAYGDAVAGLNAAAALLVA
jgi:crotonobetainyl-CoA:carnitine CoA-transferase CaiB-like acyl-CoA transferase